MQTLISLRKRLYGTVPPTAENCSVMQEVPYRPRKPAFFPMGSTAHKEFGLLLFPFQLIPVTAYWLWKQSPWDSTEYDHQEPQWLTPEWGGNKKPAMCFTLHPEDMDWTKEDIPWMGHAWQSGWQAFQPSHMVLVNGLSNDTLKTMLVQKQHQRKADGDREERDCPV